MKFIKIYGVVFKKKNITGRFIKVFFYEINRNDYVSNLKRQSNKFVVMYKFSTKIPDGDKP